LNGEYTLRLSATDLYGEPSVSDANVYIGRPMLLAVITPESSNVSPDFLMR